MFKRIRGDAEQNLFSYLGIKETIFLLFWVELWCFFEEGLCRRFPCPESPPPHTHLKVRFLKLHFDCGPNWNSFQNKARPAGACADIGFVSVEQIPMAAEPREREREGAKERRVPRLVCLLLLLLLSGASASLVRERQAASKGPAAAPVHDLPPPSSCPHSPRAAGAQQSTSDLP